jgi:nucleoside triphosphatase
MSENITWPKVPEVISGIFIKNSKGEIALFRCRKWKNLWINPGGHLEFGETIEDSMKRELLEEAGVEGKNWRFMSMGELINPPEFERPAHFIYIHYLCDYDGEFKLDNDELTDVRWFTPKEILQSPEVNETMKESVRKIMKMR